MSRLIVVAVVLGSTALGACGGSTPGTPVPVSGSPRDLAALEGQWSGEYLSLESGRGGTIVFNLKGGTDSATGEVVMSALTGGPSSPDQPAPQANAASAPPLTSAIRLVSIEDGRVRGKLEPYMEPTCQCRLTTVFDGKLYGTTLGVTYTTILPSGQVQSGRWEVTRR